MNYPLLIEGRSSSRAFQNKPVGEKMIRAITDYHDSHCQRLIPDIQTELIIIDDGDALEDAAGYKDHLIGAPQYLVLLSDPCDQAYLNAGYIMEDILLKLSDLGCGSCWLTFTDGERIKSALSLQTDKMVVALAAFGIPEKVKKRIHLNIFSMSNVSVSEQRRYFDPKKKISELVFLDTYGNTAGVEERIGFYDDLLWEAFHAAANAPSYMNRQPYFFILKENSVSLNASEDSITGPIDRDLNLGAVMLHFAAVAQEHIGSFCWKLGQDVVAAGEI